jgi:hypothetical protein
MKHISKKKLVLFGVALVVGIWLGYQTKSAFATGGMSGIFAFAGIALAGIILLILGFIALLLAKQPDGNGGPAARVTVLIAALFVAGLGGGWLGAMAVLGPTPVQLQAAGTVGLSVDGLAGYTGEGDAPATCRSEFGSEAVSWIEAVNAGDLGVDAVYVSVSLFPEAPGMQPALVVSIVPAVAASDAAPQWSGSATLIEGAAGDRVGRVTF